jgi:hypothetical protein
VAAFENMKVNLLANRLVPEKVPLVFQYNKQDLDPRIPRDELERTLNFWGRRAFPAVASRGEGVMETFVAVVQDMLAAIAVKYNLKEKGLDPDAVHEIVAQAFTEIIGRGGRPAVAAAPSAAPPAGKVIIAEPEGVEPAYPGQVGPEVNPVSEELLNRAIRANVDLAQALSQLVRDMGEGLGTIQGLTGRLAGARDEAQKAHSTAAIEIEVRRLQALLRDIGQPSASRPGATRAPGPPQTPSTPPRGTTAPHQPVPAVARLAAPPVPPVAAAAAAAAPSAPRSATPQAVAPPAAAGPVAGALDGLIAEVALAMRTALQARSVSVESRIARGAALPRCSPSTLRRALAGLFQGLAAVVAPQSAIVLRAERKPVLLRAKDGGEVKRDFLMVAATHAGGLAEAEQQRILGGSDTGPFGEVQRLVREMGGFVRFAPLPGGALETRVFLPSS